MAMLIAQFTKIIPLPPDRNESSAQELDREGARTRVGACPSVGLLDATKLDLGRGCARGATKTRTPAGV